jgi:hypothetical protein
MFHVEHEELNLISHHAPQNAPTLSRPYLCTRSTQEKLLLHAKRAGTVHLVRFSGLPPAPGFSRGAVVPGLWQRASACLLKALAATARQAHCPQFLHAQTRQAR